MKVLLFLNGFDGCQSGIEDGFKNLMITNRITELNWFYYQDFAKKESIERTINKMKEMANDQKPDLIVFFHVGNFYINEKIISDFKNISSKPIIVYDEGDMYGTWAKPLTKNIKIMMKCSDSVSIRGLGKFEKTVKKYNENVFYTPHHNDIARFIMDPFVFPEKKKDIILIGNKVKPRILSSIRRLPGAAGRENFVKKMGDYFPNEFKLYGNGWSGFKCDQGPVDFYSQNEYYRNTLITVAYEHYPEIPYYFSNRLPMALMNGSLYVCHEHGGYKELFPENDFIFFFNDENEAKAIIEKIKTLEVEDLKARSIRARDFALKYYHPNVVWDNFLTNIINYGKKQSIL